MPTDHALKSLLPKTIGHFIGGRYETIGRTFANIAPASGQTICEVPAADAAVVDAAVGAAETALRGPWGKTTNTERAAILRRIGDLIDRDRERLARLESLDTGKPLSETMTGDIARAATNFHVFAELVAKGHLQTWTSADGATHKVSRERIGIVGLITPWNLPLYLATWKLAPALGQGNAVILKPAELTPLSAMALGEILNEAGVPPGVVAIIQGFGGGGAGEALVKHPSVRAISFTGETSTGVAIMQAAAPQLKKLSFELGGKGASVIFADADLAMAATTATRAAFRNQGQICLAGSRLIVERRAAAEVIDRISQEAAKIVIGDPLDPKTTFGSLVARDHRDKVAGYVELGRKESGAEVVFGGRVPTGFEAGAYYAPTMITGVAQSSRLIQEEIFGPVLTVQTFDDFDEAMAMVNGTRYGLSCSVYTRDLAKAEAAAQAVRMGLVWINSWFLRDLHTAFGGMKQSGVGREGGQWSLDFFSELKTVSTPRS